MQSRLFWSNWRTPYKGLWLLLFATLIITTAALWTFYVNGESNVIEWERIQEQKVIETNIHSFRVGPFELSVPAESYVIFEYFNGSNIAHNHVATYLLLVVLSIGAVTIISIFTTLEKFWFFAGMGLTIMLAISLRFDVLYLFGLDGWTIPAILLTLYLGPAFYFKYFRSDIGFFFRFSVFAVLTILLWIVVAFFSGVPYPSLHLLVTAYPAVLILTLLFIIMVAHEIMVGFVYITSQGKSANGAKHFALISFIYLLNVLITALHEIGAIDWNFIYLDVFLLLTISTFLGVWAFRLREPQYEKIFSFEPFGAYFYVALAAIAFATIAQLLGNANDAAIRVVRDIIIFSHAGFGIIFFAYFFSNFLVMMGSNLPVYHLLYKPNRMPYFTFRFAGLIATAAFVFYSNWRDYVYYSFAGFYNYVGDMYLAQGDEAYALTFYEQSYSRAFRNHRANYTLATLRTDRLDFEKAKNNYELANRRPSEFSLVNDGNLLYWTGQYFEVIKTLKAAASVLPNSRIIDNNLGYVYAKVHRVDSANFYLSRARESAFTKPSAEANFFAMAAAEYIPVQADSVLKMFDSEAKAVASNALATATLFQQDIATRDDVTSEKELDLYSATYLNNYMVKHARTFDSASREAVVRIAADSVNLSFKESLKATLANTYYLQNRVFNAFAQLNEVMFMTQNNRGRYNYIAGLWSLEQGNADGAALYFGSAETEAYKEATFYKAIALTEARQVEQALMAWDSVAKDQDENLQRLAAQMKVILSSSVSDAQRFEDPLKYQFIRYKLPTRDTLSFRRLINSFQNQNYKAQALLDLSKRFFDADRIVPAIRYLNEITGIQMTDENLFNEIRFHELLMLSSRGELRQLAQQVNKGITFDNRRELEKLLFSAQLSELSGDKEKAGRIYNVLAKANPFFEDGIIAATNFFRNVDTKSTQPYEILTEAIYINTKSVRLLKAYAAEAIRQGFDEYAASAAQRIDERERELLN